MSGAATGASRIVAELERLLGDSPRDPAAVLPRVKALLDEHRKLQRRLVKISRISDGFQAQLHEVNRSLRETNEQLSQALAEVKTLRGFIPICASCKGIRDDRGYWNQLETYLSQHSDAVFSHGICPACARELYPEFYPDPAEPAPEEASPPGPRDGWGPGEEDIRTHLDALRENPEFHGHPLLAEVEHLAQRHCRQLRRLEKITRISDGFQEQLKEMNTALKAAARTDPLTGLPNRRDMVERLHAELGRSVRSAVPTAILMVDVDHFKRVNDSHGHEIGDAVLEELAGCFRESLRAHDTCARWGGEEFLVLLPETDSRAAAVVAEKLRLRVAASRFGDARAGLRVTVSVGAAACGPGETASALVQRADAALYRAKHLGRDRVEVAG